VPDTLATISPEPGGSVTQQMESSWCGPAGANGGSLFSR